MVATYVPNAARASTFFEQMRWGQQAYTVLAPRIAAKFEQRFSALFATESASYGKPTNVVYRGTRTASGEQWFDYVIHFGPGVFLNFNVAYNQSNQIAGLSFG